MLTVWKLIIKLRSLSSLVPPQKSFYFKLFYEKVSGLLCF